MTNSEKVSEFRRRRKENLIKVMGCKCAICGYDKFVGALEFHHINPEEKEYGIAANGTCHNIEKDLAEIKKCLLICANCHREIHGGIIIGDLWQYQNYDNDFAQFLIDDLKPTIYYCKTCGKQICSRAIQCSECAKKSQRICERPTREELKNLIRTMPFTQIGNLYNVSDNAIRKWCDAEGLPRKVTEIKQYSDEEWEII